MAEEEVVAPSASPVPSDYKRKFEDLESQPTESNANSNPDAENADAAVSDEGENKRPRLDDNLGALILSLFCNSNIRATVMPINRFCINILTYEEGVWTFW